MVHIGSLKESSPAPSSDDQSRVLHDIVHNQLLFFAQEYPQWGLTPPNFSLEKLHGEASNRIYYRIRSGAKSLILMQLPAGAMSASEEITSLKQKPEELPFLNIQRYLKACELPVPEIYAPLESSRLIFLEDFGDETFEKKVLASSSTDRIAWYKKAIDLLIEFQEKTAENPTRKTDSCLAFSRSFDATLLNWEFEHFFEYGIEARLGIQIAPEDRAVMREEAGRLTEAIIRAPQVLVHRDFQSRNLMVFQGVLKLLDFQDALKGPLPYDLVALLRDSYIELPSEEVSLLIGYYCGRKSLDQNTFFEMFDRMTIQRKLKDAGRFVYIDRVKKNPSFLPWIPASLRYVEQAFQRQLDTQSENKNFFERLRKYVPEWK